MPLDRLLYLTYNQGLRGIQSTYGIFFLGETLSVTRLAHITLQDKKLLMWMLSSYESHSFTIASAALIDFILDTDSSVKNFLIKDDS